MSIARKVLVAAACLIVPGVVVAALVGERSTGRAMWNTEAIQATLERVVPAHNDAYFVYVLENRTDHDYKIESDSEVQLAGRSRPTGDLVTKAGQHLSGEFPLRVPAGRKVHFALVWTAERDIDPARIDDFVRGLDVRSFVLLDKVRHYQIEFSEEALNRDRF